jgi:23S rRNA pseudouridine1911/1915/1917 synthase
MKEPEVPASELLRLDQSVAQQLPTLSRVFAASLIKDGLVSVNGQVITRPSQKLKLEDLVKIDYDPATRDVIPAITLPIIYEDNDCIVIYKPVGVLSHSKGAFNPEGTVATWLESRLQDLEGERAGIVHRLDRATSGVMILAKNKKAATWIQKQFSTRKVKKTYQAIVTGTLTPPEALIDMPIERNPKQPATFRAGVNGKPARTHYKVLQESFGYSLLELAPETGRTHQLRVHLKQLGHPIVGDTFYGGEVADRLYLHAEKLELTLPNHTRQVFQVPVPQAFDKKMIESHG